MNAWIGIIGTVVGAMLTWLISRSQSRYQEERNRRKLILEKVEEIHQLLSQYKHSYAMLTAEMLKRFCSEGQGEFPELTPIPSERLKMLVGFYAPELTRALRELEEQGASYGNLVGEHLLLGQDDKTGQKASLRLLLDQSEKIEKACEATQQDVIQLSKSYI